MEFTAADRPDVPMNEDKLYACPRLTTPFAFDEEVAGVFDDMLLRSVPFYAETVRRQAQLAARFYRPGTRIYDLGCSHGNFGLALGAIMKERPFTLVAADSSVAMLERFRRRLSGYSRPERFELVKTDIRRLPLVKASVVVLNLTLQFLPLEDRDELLVRIGQALVPGGVFLLSEKMAHDDPRLAELQGEFYHRFKRENGYSELEIGQKREALENVLLPETLAAHRRRLERAGFTTVDLWLRWFNFASLIALRKEAA